MFVIDLCASVSHVRGMIAHDALLEEMIRRLEAGDFRQTEIAKLLDVPPPRVSEMVKRKRRISQREMPILATFLGMDTGGQVPVIGFVGAGGDVIFEDAYCKGDGLYLMEALPGQQGAGMIGLEVRGDSMYPIIRDGYVAFIRRDGWDRIEADAMNDWAVCRLADGRTLLKELRKSSVAGCYDLVSTNAPPIEAVELVWATPVLGWRRRWG